MRLTLAVPRSSLFVALFLCWSCNAPDLASPGGGELLDGGSSPGPDPTDAGGAEGERPEAGGSDAGAPDAQQAFDVRVVSPVRIETVANSQLPAGIVLNALVVGDAIHVSGQASGGAAPYAFRWRSDVDGDLGTGAEADLSPTEGTHELVLVATDANGVTSTSAPMPLHVLPVVFDWSHVRRPTAPPAAGNWMTPVDHQGTCGSCWAMAAVAAAEAQINIQAGNPALDVNLSQQDVIDCDPNSLGCVGGGTEQALNGYMHDVGVPLESCIPFVGHDDVCRSTCVNGSKPVRYKIASTSYVLSPPGGSHDAVRTWMHYQLVHHGPIPRTIVNMNGYNPTTRQCAPQGGDHYAVVTGYDHASRSWILKNSWGPSWNKDGYFEVAYDHCAVDVSARIIDAVIGP